MTALELLVAAVATLYSGQPANVECLTTDAMNDRKIALGIAPETYAWAADLTTIVLYESSCENIRWIARNPARANEPGYASVDLLVLGHEVAHTLGNLDERGATCWGLGNMARVARRLGVLPRVARIMRSEARDAMRGEPDRYC